MDIQTVALDSIILDPANARAHGPHNLEAIKGSLARFGQQRPIIVDEAGVVVAGNGTVQAARALGWETIQVVTTGLAGIDRSAYAIVDNRSAELAEWDSDALGKTLDSLRTEGVDIASLGFGDEDLLKLLGPTVNEGLTDADDVPEPPGEAITQPGDLWLLGDHRLLCGDSGKADDVGVLLGGRSADLCFTSPPYLQQRDYNLNANTSALGWDGFMRGVFANLPMSEQGQVLVNLGLVHRDCEWVPYWEGWIEWMREQGWRRFGWYVWDQGYGLPGDWQGRLAPSFEFVFHFNRQIVKPHHCVPKHERSIGNTTRNCLRKKNGDMRELSSPLSTYNTHKFPDSVIRVTRANTAGKLEVAHPAVFAVDFVSFFLSAWSGLVYDPFLGSGTTIIACERAGRTCYGMEIDALYCDIIVQRWEKFAGRKAEVQQHEARN